MTTANERQVGGTHYRSNAQHWDYVAEAGWGEGYFKGVITKYLARWRKKNGVEDLEKAVHYTEKLLELVTAGTVEMHPPRKTDAPFMVANDFNTEDAAIMHTVFYAAGAQALENALAGMHKLLKDVQLGIGSAPP